MDKLSQGDIVTRKNNKKKIKGEILKIWKREDRYIPIKNTWNDYRCIKGELVARVEWENNYTSTIKLDSLVKICFSSATNANTKIEIEQEDIEAVKLKFIIKKYRWIQYKKITEDSYLVIRKDVDGYDEDADIYYIVALYHKWHDNLETFNDLSTAKNYYQERLATYL